MGLRFRQTFKLFPGARVNLGKRGFSVSIGGPGASVNLSPRGVAATVGVPGTGLSYSARLVGFGQPSQQVAAPAHDLRYHYNGPGAPQGEYSTTQIAGFVADEPAGGHHVWAPGWPGWHPAPMVPEIAQIVAARVASRDSAAQVWQAPSEGAHDADALTSEPLRDLRTMLIAVIQQRSEVDKSITSIEQRLEALTTEQQRKGFLLWSWMFTKRLAANAAEQSEAREERDECKEWLQSSAVGLDFEISDDIEKYWKELDSTFGSVAACEKVWEIIGEQRVDPRERSRAKTAVERLEVDVDRVPTPWLTAPYTPLHLENIGGGDLYFFQGFLLIPSKNNFSLISLLDLNVSLNFVPFTEEDEDDVPEDAQVMGHTWDKVNRDGSPDRRFADNFEKPIVIYAEITFSTKSGLHEVYHFSNVGAGSAFALVLRCYQLAAKGDFKGADRLNDRCLQAAKDSEFKVLQKLLG